MGVPLLGDAPSLCLLRGCYAIPCRMHSNSCTLLGLLATAVLPTSSGTRDICTYLWPCVRPCCCAHLSAYVRGRVGLVLPYNMGPVVSGRQLMCPLICAHVLV